MGPDAVALENGKRIGAAAESGVCGTRAGRWLKLVIACTWMRLNLNHGKEGASMAKRKKTRTQLERDVEDLGGLLDMTWNLMDLGVSLGTASRVVAEGCQRLLGRLSVRDTEAPYLVAVAAGVFPDEPVRAGKLLEVIRAVLR